MAVFLGATPIYLFEASDRVAKAAVVASLARVGLATGAEIASGFEVHRNTVVRLKGELEREGLAAMVPERRGPRGRHKVTPRVLEVIDGSPELGPRGMVREIQERTGVKLSLVHTHRLIQERRRVEHPELWLTASEGEERGPEVETAAESGPVLSEGSPMGPEVEPPPELAEQVRGRYMGSSLYYPAIQALGLVEAARANFRLPGSMLFGVRAVTLSLFFLTLLGRTTVEAAKHLRRWEFGPLVGAERAPSVKTLRRKLAELVKQGQASAFGTWLCRRWVEQGVIATAYLYVDGHMKEYAGKRKLSEVWNTQRRMALPGVLSYHVNDQQGRPLLFITEEANASMAQAMPKVVAAIRDALGERPFTIIFDRGGYDSKLFCWLREQKIDFITYQTGQPKLPREQFHRRECHFEGRRVRMWLAEDTVTIKKTGPWRRIVVRKPDGYQVPILTTLPTQQEGGVAPAKIACLIFARWRQENFFKYATEHHGLDHLLGTAFEADDAERMVPNPERRRLDAQLKAKRQQAAQLRAELGQAVMDEPLVTNRTAHGLKVAQRGTVKELRELEIEIDDFAEARSVLPEHVPLAQAGQREVLRLENKAIIDRIKITAYNAEEWLLERLLPHYPNPNDVRLLLRSFAELSGELRSDATGVTISLDAPDLPIHRRALRGLCADLNQLAVLFPGTHIPVTYQVSVHHLEAAA
jgi:transposase